MDVYTECAAFKKTEEIWTLEISDSSHAMCKNISRKKIRLRPCVDITEISDIKLK